MKTEQKWKIGDCLELLPEIPDKSIDMILTDLPYGITACKWDTIIPFEPLWKQYERIIKDNGAIVLFASQPFTSALVMSNITKFRYCLVWEKDKAGNILNANRQFLKIHEDICIFSKKQTVYNPQMILLDRSRTHKARSVISDNFGKNSKEYDENSYKEYTHSYPKSIIRFAKEKRGIHSTQKPIALFEYLIKTYTNEGDTVHDSCLGSGTTLEACMNLNRNCIGFEIDSQWEEHYRKRLKIGTIRFV